MDLESAAKALRTFLRSVGAPVDTDPELANTGNRVARLYADELLSGYGMDPAAILSGGTASSAPGLVVVRDIAASTTCPHHLMPASGVVHLGYQPGPRVVGFGALGRLVDCFSRRLALQEDLGQSLVDALVAHLGARGAGVVVDLDPSCMTARGERRHGARSVTSAYAGEWSDDPAARQEFLLALGASGAPAPPR